MKKGMFFKFCLLFVSALCLPHSFAQDSPQLGLPEGAKTRFGKGRISEIQYSPNDTRLAVASSIGIWLYDTATNQEVALIAGHTGMVFSTAFSPDGGTIASGRGTVPSGCGTQIPENTYTRSRGMRVRSKLLRSVRMAAPSLVGVWTLPSICGTQIRVNTCERSRGIHLRSSVLRSVRMAAPLLVGVGTAACYCGNLPLQPHLG